MSFEAMRNLIEEFFTKSTDETFGFHVVLDLFLLITKFSESVNDQTLNDGEDDNDDEEEESDVERESVEEVLLVGRVHFVSDSATCTKTRVQMKVEAGEHVLAFPVIFSVFSFVVVSAE